MHARPFMTRRALGVLALAAFASCAPKPQFVKTMPHPDGCFVQVWEGAQFTGTSQFVNGPRRYSRLDALPHRDDWAKRIRSVQVGPAATVTAWTGENLSRASVVLQPDHDYSRLPLGFDRAIQSIDISCPLMATR